ncbi:MAG: rod shape-determining protein [Clostridia bacterium]|nr:rod shape-determining protein [Clostridia bacterium]
MQTFLEKMKPENWSRDIAIDFGTNTVLVYVEGKGIVLKEPSVVAIDLNTDQVVKVGREAMEMLGREPDHMKALRPMKNGQISQYEVTLQMLKYFIRRACGKLWIPPRVLITVPTGISEVEMRAVMDASHEAGARRTYLIEEPRAAALGAGLDIRSPIGSMVLNIGGGVSNTAVLSMGGMVAYDDIPVGGDKFDEAIMNYVRQRYQLLIGERQAETIKIRIGEVYEHRKPEYMKVVGQALPGGLPKEIILSSKEMIEALSGPITAVLDSVCSVVERTPLDLIDNILKNGITMTGGGSRLHGLDRLIERVTGIPTRVAEHPVTSIVAGAGSLLPYLNQMPEGMVNIPARIGRRQTTGNDKRYT